MACERTRRQFELRPRPDTCVLESAASALYSIDEAANRCDQANDVCQDPRGYLGGKS